MPNGSLSLAEDPLKWIADHIAAGIELREQGYSLRTAKEAAAWHKQENEWTAAALDGLADWNPIDVARINTLDRIDICPLPGGHPWQYIRTNPLNCLATRLGRLQQIEQEWRKSQAAHYRDP